MTRASFFVLLLVLCSGCAQQRFSSQWALAPHLTAADDHEAESARRERERLQEVRLLKAERAEIDAKMYKLYQLTTLREASFWDGELKWSDYKPVERADIGRALARVIALTQRKNMLSGRSDQNDPVYNRGTVLPASLQRWTPVIAPYYGH